MDKFKTLNITRYNKGKFEQVEDQIIVEYPLTIYVNEREYATLLCTPEYLESLILGYMTSDFLIKDKKDVISLIVDEDKGLAYVEIDPSSIKNLEFKSRYVTSGCASSAVYYNTLDAIKLKNRSSNEMNTVSMSKLLTLMKTVNQFSDLFKETGGVHVAGLFDDEGAVYLREDIGRHNAVDKIIGQMMLDGVTPSHKVMMISGRISSEMVLKCAKSNIQMIVSRSAPMDKAIQIAKDLKIVVIGFARGERGNIYSGDVFVEL